MLHFQEPPQLKSQIAMRSTFIVLMRQQEPHALTQNIYILM